MGIADNLKKIRLDNGITQTFIAKKINMSRQGYNNYETGIREPDLKTLAKIAVILKTTTDDILGITENQQISQSTQKQFRMDSVDSQSLQDKKAEKNKYTSEETELIYSFRMLNEEGQEKMEDYAKDLVATGRYIKIDSAGEMGEQKEA